MDINIYAIYITTYMQWFRDSDYRGKYYRASQKLGSFGELLQG